MGMYTDLVFQAKLTPLGLKVVEQTINDGNWDRACKILKGTPGQSWNWVGRSSFIPFGNSYDADTIMGALGWVEGLEGDVWTVECSLKNYNSEIDEFRNDVLPYLISDPCKTFTKYEEDEFFSFERVHPIKFKPAGLEDLAQQIISARDAPEILSILEDWYYG